MREYLERNLAEVTREVYKDDAGLVRMIRDQDFSVVISEGVPLSSETALVIRGMGVVLVCLGDNPALGHVPDIVIDPLRQASNRGFFGPDYLIASVLEKAGVDRVAERLRMPPSLLVEEVRVNQAEQELLDIAVLFKKLDWDSEFFGVGIGYVSCRRLTPAVQNLVKRFVEREQLRMVEYLSDCHDRDSVLTAETAGYSFVDMRLTFERDLSSGDQLAPLPPEFTLRLARPEDISRLVALTRDLYIDSRYYFDRHFDQVKVREFYQGWVAKAVRGEFDNYVYVLCDRANLPLGFCSIREIGSRLAEIGIFGIDHERRGQGLAGHLLSSVLSDLCAKGREHIEVVTQGRNYAAQRAYQRMGFLTKKTELWYHRWLY